MNKRTVMLRFANFRLHTADHFDDICKAVKHAQRNLWIRHEVTLSDPFIKHENVFVTVEFPEGYKVTTVGHHLRGISNYLLRSKLYETHRVGNRLLNYYDVTDLVENWN